jgi:Flp pilus assembly protein TadG
MFSQAGHLRPARTKLRTLVSAPRVRRSARARAGAAAAELAILLPFLALAFAVALDFCRAYHATQTIQSSAHAGALYASGTVYAAPGTSAEDAAKQAAVAEAASLQPALVSDQITVTFTATTVTVNVAYDVPLLTSILAGAQSVSLARSVTLNLAPQGP